MGGCNTLYWIYFGKDVLRKYKSLVQYLRNNVKLKIYVPVQGLDVLIFNRNYYKPHIFLTIGSIYKEYEIKSFNRAISNQLLKVEFNMVVS